MKKKKRGSGKVTNDDDIGNKKSYRQTQKN